MKKLTIIGILAVISVCANALTFTDHFDDGVIGPEWTVTGTGTESGTIVSFAGGNYMNTAAVYEGNFYAGLRNFYDSRNLADYSAYTLGYVGLGNLLARNDNQGGGYLVVQSFTSGTWNTLTSIYTGDYQLHDIDIAFEWVPAGLLITLDDLATPGIDVQTLTTDPQYIPANSGQIWDVGNQTLGGTWDLDFVSVVPEPVTMLLLGFGGLLIRKRR